MLRSLLLSMCLALTVQANAQENQETEFNPFDPNAEKMLEEYDRQIEKETGEAPFLQDLIPQFATCYKKSCSVYAEIDKDDQRLYLYIDGIQRAAWPVSTGVPGYGTPNLDTHPSGRIYDKYTSTKWPGGDYNGLGNMPYAVFVRGGIAIHGTPKGNWPKLGTKASHGCIRLHPDNGFTFNRLVRKHGRFDTWITIQ